MEEARLTGVGRGFQNDHVAYTKQRLPNPSKQHLGTLRRLLVSRAYLEYTETTNEKFIQGIYHEQRHFAFDSLLNSYPIQFFQDRSDTIKFME